MKWLVSDLSSRIGIKKYKGTREIPKATDPQKVPNTNCFSQPNGSDGSRKNTHQPAWTGTIEEEGGFYSERPIPQLLSRPPAPLKLCYSESQTKERVRVTQAQQ